MEIYQEVLKDEGKGNSEKFRKRLSSSIGWVQPEVEHSCRCDVQGKTWQGAEIKREDVWEVNLGEVQMTCKRQEDAEILSYLAQINERLKRIENKLK